VRVEVRLFATLADHVERATAAEPFCVELTERSTIAELIAQLGLPAAEVHLAVIDGRTIHDRATSIAPGSRVSLFPPVGGG